MKRAITVLMTVLFCLAFYALLAYVAWMLSVNFFVGAQHLMEQTT